MTCCVTRKTSGGWDEKLKPVTDFTFKKLMAYRFAQQKVVDTRVSALREIINNIRAVKLYAYETFFLHKVSDMRSSERGKLKSNGRYRAAISGGLEFVPVLAAVCVSGVGWG